MENTRYSLNELYSFESKVKLNETLDNNIIVNILNELITYRLSGVSQDINE